MEIELNELYYLQSTLDKDIANRHNVTYASTHKRRCLALIVELGELANETRCFKYWSTKGASPKDVILEEYVDGLHFFLSLGIPLNIKKTNYQLINEDMDLTDNFYKVYELVIKFVNDSSEENYINAFQSFLNIIVKLDWNSNDVIDAYKKKLDINFQRQINKY